jgi:predicted branched-subunit amino acid permease
MSKSQSEMQAAAIPVRLPDVDKRLFRAGVRIGLPTMFGIVAWGMVVGVAMIKAHLSIPQALAMTLLVFAGSAQLASLPLIAAHAPIWVVFITALVVNLRFVIFSALLAPHFSHLPWYKRLYMGFLSGDVTVALFLLKFSGPEPAIGKLSYLQGLVYPNWLSWQVGSIIGIFMGSQIPAAWGFGFAGTLAIICVTVPLVLSRATLCGVIVAGVVSVMAVGLPYKLGMLSAVMLGMLTAMAVQEWWTPKARDLGDLRDTKNLPQERHDA